MKKMKRLAEYSVGEGTLADTVVLRFFLSTDNEETPEIYWLPVPKELVPGRDGADVRVSYVGNPRVNAIPLRTTDLDSLIRALQEMKDRVLIKQANYHTSRGTGFVTPVKEARRLKTNFEEVVRRAIK